uniref:Stress response protein NST1 n=1 Tax=Pyricularia oryzae (strain P131) TaxID=1143193 RepID=L7JDN1_PYRO1
MKGNRRQPAVASQPTSPASPTPSKGTSKYANRDGSKIISVPKPSLSVETPQPSPTVSASMPPPTAGKGQPPSTAPTAPSGSNASGGEAAPTVNRKKAKRRAKLAAKAAAEAGLSGDNLSNGVAAHSASSSLPKQPSDAGHSDNEGEALSRPSQTNGHTSTGASKSKKGRKSKNEDGRFMDSAGSATGSNHHAEMRRPPSPIPHASPGRASGISKEKIWNTSSQEERQRIKEFWLGLGEEERKSLVKVEKDAVLKKMKEQQKQTCSCTVCGRKRTAIEEELEGLYDAYYEELESFANQPNPNGDVPPMLGPTGHFGSTAYTSQIMPSKYPPRQPSRGRIVEHCGDDEDDDGEDEYSEEELDDDEDYSDDEEPEEMHRQRPTEYQTDFFNFGNSLTVQGTRFHESLNSLPPYAKSYMEQVLKYVFRRDVDHSLGGILTVADDLLKNDGKKFIEMMEQLAERRMQREEDAKEQFARNYHINGNNYPAHAHPPPPEDDEEYEDEEEEEEYDSQDEEYDEEEVQTNPVHCACHCPCRGGDYGDAGMSASADDGSYQDHGQESHAKQHRHLQDSMTEEQRMEEGRRMFQIFAARMFEQRRRDKALQKKQAQAEEKARKDAEKAAEEAERLAEEQRRQEEQRQKNEERKKKKEAQRKAEEEERQRKEAERLRRAQEQKERQAEQDRKAREAKEKEKKAKEEAKQREKAARELKEREARERKEKADKERLEKEAKIKAEKEAREAQRKAERASQKATTLANVPVPTGPARRQSQAPNPAPALPQSQQASVASPQLPTAVPALPKLPTPQKPRRTSQQEPFTSGFAAQQVHGQGAGQYPAPPKAATPVHTSPGPGGLLSKGSSSQGQSLHSQATSPLGTSLPTSTSLPTPFGMPHPPPNQHYPPGIGPLNAPPGLGGPRLFNDYPEQMYQQSPFGFRQATQQHPQLPPGLGIPMGPGRGLGHGPPPPPGLSAQQSDFPNMPASIFGSIPKEPSPLSSHSRQASANFDSPIAATPIARPTPIGRPGSVVQGRRGSSDSPGRPGQPGQDNLEEISAPHLGSSALLDDLDEPLMDDFMQDTRSARRSIPGPPQSSRFPPPAVGSFPMSNSPFGPSLWSQPGPSLVNQGFGGSFGQPAPPPGFNSLSDALSVNSPWTFASRPPPRHNLPQMRKVLIQACLDLASTKTPLLDEKAEDPSRRYLPITAVKKCVDTKFASGSTFTVDDLMSMTNTEGNANNGGGSFDTQEFDGELCVRWVPDDIGDSRTVGRSVGEIGSPIVGSRG